jgi:hypothetical protein
MISLLAVMRSGEQIEIGIVGADGLVGGGVPSMDILSGS